MKLNLNKLFATLFVFSLFTFSFTSAQYYNNYGNYNNPNNAVTTFNGNNYYNQNSYSSYSSNYPYNYNYNNYVYTPNVSVTACYGANCADYDSNYYSNYNKYYDNYSYNYNYSNSYYQNISSVVTTAASYTNANSATLNGNVIGNSGTAWFVYGTNYNNLNMSTNPAQFNNNTNISANLNNLNCGTTYYYKAVANGFSGTISGNILSFTTAKCSNYNNNYYNSGYYNNYTYGNIKTICSPYYR